MRHYIYNFFVILKHTIQQVWVCFYILLRLSMKLSLDLSRNVFQYNFSPRFLSQDCGLFSPCNKIVLGVVLAKKLHN